jgi:hypothetical protein
MISLNLSVKMQLVEGIMQASSLSFLHHNLILDVFGGFASACMKFSDKEFVIDVVILSLVG